MNRSILVSCLCLLPLLFAGCNSDDLLNIVNPEQGAEAAVAEATTQVLAPAIERFNLVEVFAGTPTKAGLGQACSQVDQCTSGTWQHCENPKGFDYTFDACMLDGEMVDGTLSAAGSDVAGTVNYNLTVDGLSYSGYISFTQNDSCLVESMSQFTVQDSSRVSIFSGELTYCPGSPYPAGSVDVTISGSSSFSLDMTFDGSQTVAMVYDDGNETTYTCTAGLATGGATCQ